MFNVQKTLSAILKSIKSMKPIYQEDINDLDKIFNITENDDAIKSVLLFICDKTPFDADSLNHQLRKLEKPIIGGIFPGLIYGEECKYLGFIIIPLPFKLETSVFHFDESESAFNNTLSQLNTSNQSRSVFIFYDAMDFEKSRLIDYLFNFFGISLSYFGAGCGQLNFEPSPCVISNEGLSQSCCVIGLTTEDFAMGMSRSWEPISDQMKASEVANNSLRSVNWESTTSVYKSIIEKHLEKSISDEELPHLLKSYPIGIVKIDGDIVVRDPYKLDNDEIVFFDSIYSGEHVCVLHGDKNSILHGAENAKISMIEKANKMGLEAPEYILCVNCISRALYLKEDYKKELEILNVYRPTFGILSIGEIINPGNSILEIFNKILALASWKPGI